METKKGCKGPGEHVHGIAGHSIVSHPFHQLHRRRLLDDSEQRRSSTVRIKNGHCAVISDTSWCNDHVTPIKGMERVFHVDETSVHGAVVEGERLIGPQHES